MTLHSNIAPSNGWDTSMAAARSMGAAGYENWLRRVHEFFLSLGPSCDFELYGLHEQLGGRQHDNKTVSCRRRDLCLHGFERGTPPLVGIMKGWAPRKNPESKCGQKVWGLIKEHGATPVPEIRTLTVTAAELAKHLAPYLLAANSIAADLVAKHGRTSRANKRAAHQGAANDVA